jgi:ABC-type uncharacterized transport system ATPase subunit
VTAWLLAELPVVDVNIVEPSIESIISTLFGREAFDVAPVI